MPLNFTGNSAAVAGSECRVPLSIAILRVLTHYLDFQNTGDFARGGNLEALGSLLDQGVKVALVYGDRDYQCNCTSPSSSLLSPLFASPSSFQSILFSSSHLIAHYGLLVFATLNSLLYFISSLCLPVPTSTSNKPFSGLGGEQISLAINSSQSASFHSAGYANITANSTYVGGVVRQSGNLSFSRVFQAGHMGKPRSSPCSLFPFALSSKLYAPISNVPL